MATWDSTSRACKTLWTTLFKMNQLVTNFDDSGSVKISDLTFYDNLGSSASRKQDATVLADQLDNTFINGRGASYKAGITRSAAMQAMIDILTNGDKTVADLSSAIDPEYQFI